MWKVAKYKILTLLSDKVFKTITILFFIILNYQVFINSGVLSAGSENFNELLKYTLLINNYTIVATSFGLIIAIYVGNGLIGNDILSGKMYIMLTSFPKRWKYLIGNFLGLFIVLTTFIFMILFNYFISTMVLNVSLNISDLLQCFIYIFINMLVITVITAIGAIFLNGKASILVGLIEMVIFNIYTFQKIPFLDHVVNLNITTRRVLACFAPITNVSAPSIYSDGSLERYLVTPIVIDNMLIYQIIFIFVILVFGIVAFKHKEL